MDGFAATESTADLVIASSWLGAPEYGEARAGRNSDFARIWRNAIKGIILSMIVLLRYQTVLCVVLGYLT